MINKISKIIEKKYRRKFLILMLTLLIGILFEMISIGIILPLIATLIDPSNSVNIIKNFPINLNFLRISENNIIFYAIILVISIFIVKNITLYFLNKFQAKTYADFNEALQNTLFKKYLYQPINYLMQINTALINRNVIDLSSQFTFQFVGPIILTLIESIFLLGILIILFIANPTVTLLGFFVISIFSLVIFLLNKKILFKAGETHKFHLGKRIKYLHEAFGGILEVKSFKKEEYFFSNFSEQNKVLNSLQVKVNILQYTPKLFLETIIVILLSFLIIFFTKNNNIIEILPLLGLYVYSLIRILPSLNKILFNIQRARYSLPILNEIYFVINSLQNFNDENSKKIIFNNNVELKNISYGYDKSKKVLDNINFQFKKNSLTGLIGQSGSGKSTLLKILMGLLKPNEGKFLVDDKSIDEFLNSWQNKISFVPQDVYILDDNLIKNIALGVDENKINLEQLNYSIKSSNLNNFVDNLPQGINTVLGEKGSRVSGGQRQRIGIARALYNQPEVLVLDEATSSLDEKNELELLEELNLLKKKITIIFATHRKALRKYCDTLFEIEDTKINRINF